MTKEEFLTELRTSLTGNVSSDLINDNLNYYEDYINTEIRKGKSEEEVLDGLGSPRLLARTITETAAANDLRGARAAEAEDEEESERELHRSDVMPWWMILIVIFGIMIAIYLVVSVTAALFPIIAAVLIAMVVVKFLRKKD